MADDNVTALRTVPISHRDMDEQRAALEVKCPYEPCSAEIGEVCTYVAITGERIPTTLQHSVRVNLARREGGR